MLKEPGLNNESQGQDENDKFFESVLNYKHEPEYNFDDFEYAEQYLRKIICDMLPAINNHEYDMILGDDASGRIPTLVLQKFIAEAYKRDGVKPPETLFYAAGSRRDPEDRDLVYKKISEDLKRKKAKIKEHKKALIVTEYIASGSSMDEFIKSAKDAGIDCDVATLFTDMDEDFYRNRPTLPNLKNVKIYTGRFKDEENAPLFYKKSGVNGVYKDHRKSNIHSELAVENPASINEAREDVNTLVAKLVKEYLPEK